MKHIFTTVFNLIGASRFLIFWWWHVRLHQHAATKRKRRIKREPSDRPRAFKVIVPSSPAARKTKLQALPAGQSDLGPIRRADLLRSFLTTLTTMPTWWSNTVSAYEQLSFGE